MRKLTLLVASLCLVAASAVADVTFEQEARMGGLMKVLTLGRGMKTVTRISGDRMRTDSGNEVQIVDLAEEKILTLDTKKKTYTVMSFEEMRKRMDTAVAAIQGKPAASSPGQEAPEYSTRTNIQVTDTGKEQDIGGYPSKQYLLQFDVTMKNEETQEEGTLSTVTEAWLTKSAPGVEEIEAFYRKMAEKLGTTEIARQMVAGGNEQSNQFASGMREMAAELKEMEGFAVRTVFYFGAPDAAAAEAMKSGGGDEGESGEKKRGRFGGLLKKAIPVGGEEEQEGAGQGQGSSGGVLMRMTVETKKIETGKIDPSLFSVPGGYKEAPLETR